MKWRCACGSGLGCRPGHHDDAQTDQENAHGENCGPETSRVASGLGRPDRRPEVIEGAGGGEIGRQSLDTCGQGPGTGPGVRVVDGRGVGQDQQAAVELVSGAGAPEPVIWDQPVGRDGPERDRQEFAQGGDVISCPRPRRGGRRSGQSSCAGESAQHRAPPVVEEHVGGVDPAVHQPHAMQVGHGLGDGSDDEGHLRGRKGDCVGQRPAAHPAGAEFELAVGGGQPAELHHTGMGGRSKDESLVGKPLVATGSTGDLHGHGSSRRILADAYPSAHSG
jgi:hypothetical protein